MSNKVLDAWDDDYEVVADGKYVPTSTPTILPRISRAERRAQHEAANKQLWESAENPQPFHYVEAQDSHVTLVNADLKPTMKVLSRKPTKAAPADGGAKSENIDQDDIDSEEEERKEQARLFQERQRKAAEERAEKQRKYAERREQLFGPSNSTAGSSSGGSGRESPTTRNNGRQRARGDRRGGGASFGRNSPANSSADQSPARSAKQLYDPTQSERPASAYFDRRNQEASPAAVQKPIRAPRGPDGSGKGGFGFAPRGNKTGV